MRSRETIEKRGIGGKSSIGIVFLIAILWCFPYCNLAGAACSSTDMIEITVEGGDYIGYCTIIPSAFAPDYWNQVFSNETPIAWNLQDTFPTGINIAAEDNQDIILAHLDGLTISFQGDPVASLGFAVTAGQYPTSFSFSSPLMTFDPLIDANVGAEAAILVTGPADKTLWGSYTGGKAYKALYNDTTTFAYLVDTPITAYSGEDTWPFQALPGTITSMQSKFQFILSAQATASGSSYYEITGTVVPEPASILLLGLGGLALLKKRRV
jgi:hypothetical protein